MEIPYELQTAIDKEASFLTGRIEAVVAQLSNRYRSGYTEKFVRSRDEVVAYAAYRMPATFAAVVTAMRQMSERLPDWQPGSLLDVGCGPGTVMWAASSVWPEDLKQITLYEREKDMIELGGRLASSSSYDQIREAQWNRADLAGNWNPSRHDLVVASYVLGELKPDLARRLIDKLWECANGGILLLIEPGTPEGFLRIRHARDQLLAAGGRIIAPCPHHVTCPMESDNWCHFAQRVARSRLHRMSKGASLGYEDEKFSFLAVSSLHQQSPIPVKGRILRHPLIRKGHIIFEACTSNGLEKIAITRKNKEAYREARHMRWGAAFPTADE